MTKTTERIAAGLIAAGWGFLIAAGAVTDDLANAWNAGIGYALIGAALFGAGAIVARSR